jgi:peptidoglycan/LPS O-acetylase OafA/YrhL
VGWVWFFWLDHEWKMAHAVLPFVLPILCVSAFKSVLLRKFFAHPWIAVIGGMCYSIYLLHLTFIAVVFKFTRHAILFNDFLANYVLQILVTGVPVLLLCGVFFLLVERPCMDPAWPAKLWQRLTDNREQAHALDATAIAD